MNAAERGEVFERAAPFVGTFSGGRESLERDEALYSIEVCESFSATKNYWRALEGELATPYQSYDFLSLWFAHVGAKAGLRPCILVGLNRRKQPLFLLPLCVRTYAAWRIAQFMGGKHVNVNMGLWRHGAPQHLSRSAMSAAMAELAIHADVLWLRNQPKTWNGVANPLLLLPHRNSVSPLMLGRLSNGFEDLVSRHTNSPTRRSIRKKRDTLRSLGRVEFERVTGAERARTMLELCFHQKRVRMVSLGLRDPFADPDVRRFIEEFATLSAQRGAQPFRIYALLLNADPIAILGGLVGESRFCGLLNSITSEEAYLRCSPGEQLLWHVVKDCCQNGLKWFDLGIGDARYKQRFCEPEPLFDSIVPITSRGRPAAMFCHVASVVKCQLKQQRYLRALSEKVRSASDAILHRPPTHS